MNNGANLSTFGPNQGLGTPSTIPNSNPSRITALSVACIIFTALKLVLNQSIYLLTGFSTVFLYSSVICGVIAQVLVVIVFERYLSAKYQAQLAAMRQAPGTPFIATNQAPGTQPIATNQAPSAQPVAPQPANPPVIAIIAIILGCLFGAFDFFSAIALVILPLIIIPKSYAKPDSRQYLLKTTTIIGLVFGALILAGWVLPILIGSQMSGSSAQAFGIVISLVYAPLYSGLRVSACVPTILSFILLVRIHRASTKPNTKGTNTAINATTGTKTSNGALLLLNLLAILLVLSPVIYSVSRRVIQSNDPAMRNRIGSTLSSSRCGEVFLTDSPAPDRSLSYYADDLACAYLYYEYAERTQPTTQTDILKYLPDDFFRYLSSKANPRITINESNPEDAYVFNILPRRHCSLEDTSPDNSRISVWVRDPSSNMTFACAEIGIYKSTYDLFDINDADHWYPILFGN